MALKPNYPDLDTPKAVKGNPNAEIQIIEFSDLECPACAVAHPVINELVEQYKDQVSLTFKHFPLTFHQHAHGAAEAAECANDQGKFWEFIDLAYENQKALSDSDLISYAEQVGLDIKDFKACLKSDAKSVYVDRDYKEALDLELTGTPTLIVNGEVLESWKLLKSKIESLLD